MIVKRIVPLSLAKIAGTLYAIMGLLIGCIFSLIAMAGGFGGESSRIAGLGAIVGVGSIIILPIFYGAIGFVATLIGAWIYNGLAGLVGGIELDVQ
jgi:hypothetical protein